MRILAFVACLLVASRAYADDEIVRGNVVKIEAQEIYVSIGVNKGVTSGASLRIKRPISLKHPVTRATVQDWIPIGSASVTQAGSVMSRAVLGELSSDVKVGDIAEVLVDRPDAAGPPSPARPQEPPPVPQGPQVDPATAEVLGVFAAQSNQPLDARIAAWERYLSMRANSPYAEGIRADLDELHALRDQLYPRNASSPETEMIVTVSHEAPKRAMSGQQVPLVFVLEKPQDVASAYLHYRPRGNRTYRSVLLVREHDIYLRGALPPEVVKTPGVDYFVEVSTPSGRSGLAIGTPREPIQVEVAQPSLLDRFGSEPGMSSVKLSIEYLDFATFDKRAGDHTDQMVQANVDFIYKLHSAVESLGVGYGVYAGSGGEANTVWDPNMNPIPKAGFHYGYADIEVGGKSDGTHLSAGTQLIAGVGKQGFGLGWEGRFRIGERTGTNLAFIGRTIEEVGFLTDIRFGSQVTRGMLLGVSVGATNQPNRGDVGVKLGTDIEVITWKNVSLILQGSWQGRTTTHGGIGGGGGLGFYW
ncbi:MAG TPA: hypothetical protein VL326_32345 [Kofleriaceae bacterium]|nr:hypothetical protein [Kofleriaceae bacterium]